MTRLCRLAFPALFVLVSGCGIRGDLERPPPVFGPDTRTEEERAYESEYAAGSEDGPADLFREWDITRLFRTWVRLPP